MRIVLDTNIAISGLLGGGLPTKLIDAAVARDVTLIGSTATLSELDGVLRRPKFAQRIADGGLNVDILFNGYVSLVQRVTAAKLAHGVSRDSNDDMFLAAAVGGNALMIVSGDDDLLELKSYEGINILTVASALTRVGLV